MPLNVVALHDFDTCHVVGPRRHFNGLPHDVLITSASQARMALRSFVRDSGTMTRLRILLANGATRGIACNRLKDPAVIERLANLVEHGVFGLAQIKPIRTAEIRGLHQQFVETHPASAEARRACASVMPVANRTAHPPATLASLHRSGAHTSSNSSQPVATPASPAPNKKAFSEWSLEDRFAEALKRTAPKLPSQVRNAFAEILTPEVAATVVGTLVLIAGAHAIGGLVAAAFDALLIGVAFVFLGWTAFEAGQQLGKFFYLSATATDVSALDEAAEALARVIVLIGVEALLVLLTKAAVKASASRHGPSIKPSSPQPSTGSASASGHATRRPPPRGDAGKPAISTGQSEITTAQVTRAKELGVAPQWVDGDGRIIWPPNDGFAAKPTLEELPIGTRIDRYGPESGSFLSPTGTPFAQRALPDSSRSRGYSVYEVQKPLPVQSGKVAAWFDHPGGGTQYRLLNDATVEELLDLGYLKRLSP